MFPFKMPLGGFKGCGFRREGIFGAGRGGGSSPVKQGNFLDVLFFVDNGAITELRV